MINNFKSLLANKNIRWDWVLLGLGSLIFWGVTTTPSAYFLHFDTPVQDVAALEWSHGCWEYNTEKYVAILILTPLFKLFGATPLWEVGVLMIGTAISVICVYELTYLITRAKIAGLLSVLLLIALPAFQYFSRTHIGYIAPCLLLAWLAIWHDKWGWAGLFFSLAVLAHFNAALAAGISFFTLGLFYLRLKHWRKWFNLSIAGILPILVIEILFFFYYGQIFQWTLGTFGVGLRWSGIGDSPKVNLSLLNLLWLPKIIVGSNGWFLSSVLLLSIPAILIYRKDPKTFALNLTFLGVTIGYMVLAVLRSGFVSRALAPFYPFWSLGAVIVLWWFIGRISNVLLRRVIFSVALAGLMMFLASSLIFIRGFTQTLYPQIEQLIINAAKQNRSVRHFGNPWIPLFYADLYGVELVSGYEGWIDRNQPGQSILIFETTAPPALNSFGYRIEKIDMPNEFDSFYPILTQESNISRHFEIWWPTQPSQSVEPLGNAPSGKIAIHYSGKGCITAPPFDNGTKYYYQLVWDRLLKRVGLR